MSKPATTDRAISFAEAMFLLFLGLRLSGHIDWAWYLIGMPLIIQILMGVACAAFVVWLERKERDRR